MLVSPYYDSSVAAIKQKRKKLQEKYPLFFDTLLSKCVFPLLTNLCQKLKNGTAALLWHIISIDNWSALRVPRPITLRGTVIPWWANATLQWDPVRRCTIQHHREPVGDCNASDRPPGSRRSLRTKADQFSILDTQGQWFRKAYPNFLECKALPEFWRCQGEFGYAGLFSN